MGDCKDSEKCKERHLCKLFKRGDLERIKELARDALYVCKKCGRAAHDKDHLCDPSRI